MEAGSRAPAARVASVLISSGYYIRCHGEERGERAARWPSARGGEGRESGRAGTHLCALLAPCGCCPRACRGRGGAGRRPGGPTCPQLPSRPREHSGSGRNVLFLLRRLAWVYSFLAPGVCTLKHLFNIKEAACAAVLVRSERVAVGSGAVNESSPRRPGADDSCGVHPAHTPGVPLTQGRRPFLGGDALEGRGRGNAKGRRLIFPPPPAILGNFGGGRVPTFPEACFPLLEELTRFHLAVLMSRWRSADSLQGWIVSHSESGWL